MLAPDAPCTSDSVHSLLDLPPELWIAILRLADVRAILRCTAVGLPRYLAYNTADILMLQGLPEHQSHR